MKLIRTLAAVTVAFLALGAVSRAADDKCHKDEKKCDCPADKDGKKCGVDKDCCCTGEKAAPAPKK